MEGGDGGGDSGGEGKDGCENNLLPLDVKLFCCENSALFARDDIPTHAMDGNRIA